MVEGEEGKTDIDAGIFDPICAASLAIVVLPNNIPTFIGSRDSVECCEGQDG